MTRSSIFCGAALLAAFGLNIGSVGLAGPRPVGLGEAQGVWGGTVTLAAGPPSCAAPATCGWFFGCAAKTCVTCPPTPNFSYITGASVPATVVSPCAGGTSTGICVSGWTGCFCTPPPFLTPCGFFTLNTLGPGSG